MFDSPFLLSICEYEKEISGTNLKIRQSHSVESLGGVQLPSDQSQPIIPK